jgi:hypothetical protein
MQRVKTGRRRFLVDEPLRPLVHHRLRRRADTTALDARRGDAGMRAK